LLVCLVYVLQKVTAMMKILYILPVLAVLGMISGADATADQERIDELEAKIDRLEDKIDRLEDRIDRLDPATDQKRIDKIEAKIDKFEARIDKFEAQIDRLEARDNDADTTEKDTGDTTQTQQERYSRGTAEQTGTPDKGTPATSRATIDPDTAPPTFVSATYNSEGTPLTLTIKFSEAIDVSQVSLDDMTVFDVTDRYQVYWSLSGTNVVSSSDSEVLELTLPEPYRNAIGELDTPKLGFEAGAVRDVEGNEIDAATDLLITLIPARPVPTTPVQEDPTVTIQQNRFDANVRTIELDGATTFTVEFVNNSGADKVLLIDLMHKSTSYYQSHDCYECRNNSLFPYVSIPDGDSETITFDVTGLPSGETAYLLYNASDGFLAGDHFIKVVNTQ